MSSYLLFVNNVILSATLGHDSRLLVVVSLRVAGLGDILASLGAAQSAADELAGRSTPENMQGHDHWSARLFANCHAKESPWIYSSRVALLQNLPYKRRSRAG
jgi:hypothetical protein